MEVSLFICPPLCFSLAVRFFALRPFSFCVLHPLMSTPLFCLIPVLPVSPLTLQTRTPRVTRLSPTQPALADQANRVSFASAENLETMSEPDLPIGFNRMNRLRQSLPLARSSSQAKLRAPGQIGTLNATTPAAVEPLQPFICWPMGCLFKGMK